MRTQSLFLVHAHPDDESIITGGLILRAREDGHRIVLVTCTGGEEGEVHNLDAAVRSRLGEVRERELRAACAILGVDRLELLGYRDSGMAGSPANEHPDSFHRASLDEVTKRLVLLLWAERPDTVVTYGPDGTYGHPDHLKAHEATMAALDVLRREGWCPARALWHAVPASGVRRLGGRAHPAMRAVGTPDEEITMWIDMRPVLPRKREAVAAHVSQNPPDLTTAMIGQVLEAMAGFEHFMMAGGPDRRPPAHETQEIVKSAAGSESTTT
jgi:N-acetyl-1-D-myo-inositol-2-amino-2-deoxy-alpha-D-glucopyranoside deacetylase